VSGRPGREALERLVPEPAAALAEVERVSASSVDAHTLELVRDRVWSLLGDMPSPLDDWRSRSDLDERDRALLAFVEQFVFSVSSMGDDDVDRLLAHERAERLHELSNVVWAVDLACRLDLVATAVLA
jgi:alkylhydroperoxidase family enzyme